MKIIIIGKNSYVTKNLLAYLNQQDMIKSIKATSARNGVGEIDFEQFDVCIYTAALVHKKESNYKEIDYFNINTDLTIEIAEKAKNQGVKHFIFLSTMAVYGLEQGKINQNSLLQPKTFYGKSKLAAEQALQAIQDKSFTVSIVRPPMIYGPNCPGNYLLLRKLAKKTPIFPYVQNQRSMLFIDNLCEFINQLIINKDAGVFHPQDEAFINTAQMVLEIAKQNKHYIFFSKIGGVILNKAFINFPLIKKVFGNLTYEKEISQYNDNSYQRINFIEAIRKTEDGWKETIK